MRILSRTRRAMLAAASLCILLVGCQTPETVNPGVNTAMNTLVAETQIAATATCQFEPASHSIVQILALNNPQLHAAAQIAKAICDLVIDRRLSGGGAGDQPLSLEGVLIEGRDLTLQSP